MFNQRRRAKHQHTPTPINTHSCKISNMAALSAANEQQSKQEAEGWWAGPRLNQADDATKLSG